MAMRILLVDDHKILRDGLRALLESDNDMEVVAEAEDGRTAIDLAKTLVPDVVIMDLAMPGLNGIDATQSIRKENPKIKIVALSMHSDKQYVDRVLKAGATGYLLKDCAFEELASAIRTVFAGGTYLGAKITGLVIEGYVHRLTDGSSCHLEELTARERDVLRLMADGQNTKEIALILKVSTKTIESHRRNIMNKLKIYNLAELTKYALRAGLSSLEG